MTALEYFASEEKMANAIENPDEGIDWIIKMESPDWQSLLLLWDNRSTTWREALMYFGGLVELDDSLPLLAKGLSDSDPNIYLEAALSIADAVLEGDEVILSDEIKNRLREIAQSPIGKDFDELQDLLKGF